MALIYITGLSGSGKSTVCKELIKRGYEAHDADSEGFNRWCNRKTGLPVIKWLHSKNADKSEKWTDDYAWDTSRIKVRKLAKRAKNKLIFLCGISANEETVLGLFAKVICLAIDKKTLKYRLATRTTNDFGKAPHQLKKVLEWHGAYLDKKLEKGAIAIDATQPIEKVTQQVLDIISV
jgi:dephospho-CoA kinase